jgi:Protein of unknown function (DUF2934)
MATRRPTQPPDEKTSATPPAPAPTRAAPRAKSSTGAAAAGTPRVRKKAAKAPTEVAVSEDVRRGMIAEAAYLRAERRGFAPGGEHDDWVAAEAEVDALLRARGTSQ